MSAQPVRPTLMKWLYTNNPFYAISAVLMLFGVRSAYGDLQIGEINCWLMMGTLAAYTSLLAGIGVLIVRWGKVWEDARSILVLLLLLFLAVSISADDLFVTMESATGGVMLLVCGYLFSACVTESVLWFARIRLGLAYRVPYHLLLVLFYVAPWWCSPELHPRDKIDLEWAIAAFPVVASFLIVGLVPAVRRGPRYADQNGTPWKWPWFPWTAFGVLIAAVGLRTFALCMTFGPSGPIWVYLKGGARVIAFDTMWSPYFLILPAFAVAVLVFEAGIVTGNRKLVRRVLMLAPLLLVLALPFNGGTVSRGFLRTVTDTLGSPLWLTVWLLLGFYAIAWFRKVQGGGIGLMVTTALLSVVGRETIGPGTVTEPSPWPLLAVGAALLARGIQLRSSIVCTSSFGVLTLVTWQVLPDSMLSEYRMTICYHLLWVLIVIGGLAFSDRFASTLRLVGALQAPLAALVVMVSPVASEVPATWRIIYVVVLAAGCLAIAKIWRSKWYLYAFTALMGMGFYGGAALGFRSAVGVLGRAAITAFCWSVGALLLAFLISAHKANWLPRRLFPRWGNGFGHAASPPSAKQSEAE